MATRRRRFMRRRRRSPLSTRSSTEPKWRQAFFNFAQQHTVGTVAGQFSTQQSLVINPTLMLEELQVTTAGMGRVEGALSAMRGVHVGGVVWQSTFLCLTPGGGGLSDYLVDYTICQERLLTQEVDDQGFPAAFPDYFLTWRPISGSDNDDTPKDNDGQLVRVHKFRNCAIATGDNAYFHNGASPESAGTGSFATGAGGMAGWGPNSLRLKRFIADNQQLVFQVNIQTSSAETNDRSMTWICQGTVYYRLGWR